MAVLNQTPFQLPDFAKMAYEKSLVDEEKQRREEEREKQKKAERRQEAMLPQAKSSYLDNTYKLDPNRLPVANMAWQIYEKAAQDYILNGNPESLDNANSALKDFQQVLNVGVIASAEGRRQLQEVKSNPYAYDEPTRSGIESQYNNYVKFDFVPQVENGVLTVLSSDGKTRVPVSQSPGFSIGVAQGPGGNALNVNKEDPYIKLMNPMERAAESVQLYGPASKRDQGDVTFYDVKYIQDNALKTLDHDLRLEVPGGQERRRRIATEAAARIKGGLPSNEEVEIILNDPTRFSQVVADYKKLLAENIQAVTPSKTVTGRGGDGSGLTKYDVNELNAFFYGAGSAPISGGGIKISPQNYLVKVGGTDIPITSISFDSKGEIISVEADTKGMPSLKIEPEKFKTAVVQNLTIRNIKGAVSKAVVNSMNSKGKQPK
jgi:hypothetical protein